MGRLRHLWRFVNLQDLRRALRNPQKALRVLKSIVHQRSSRSEHLDEVASQDDRRDLLVESFDIDEQIIDEYLDTLAGGPVPKRIRDAEAFFEEKSYGIGGMRFNGETLYLLTRLLEPDTVLEIGVANGMSTAYLLAGLEDAGSDGKADVYAIDRPLFESAVRERRGAAGLTGGIVPDEKEAGWIASRELRTKYGHQYYVGDFIEILGDILADLGSVDLVVYDASKDAKEMQWAYERCIDALNPGGMLLSDDVLVNDAFDAVTGTVPGTAEIIHNSGLYRAPR